MWWINCGNEKWDSTSYKISERYDLEAKWMAFLSFLDVLPKDSRLFAHLVKFCSSAQCLQISIRWCSNQASQYGVQYPTHMPEWRKTDCHGTRTDIPFDHHNLDKTVSKFISQRKSNILVSSSYTTQMRSFSLSQSVSSNNHLPSNSIVHPQEKASSEGPWVTRSSESVGNWRLCIVIFHTILPSRRAAHL